MALNIDTLGLSATITAQGISAPGYQTILNTLTGFFQQIYGSDAYLEPDSKDGQMVALVALAIKDANNAAIRVYNSFSPSTGMGAALSRNVKINGITRHRATNSTVDVTLTGTAGTTIVNGSVRDTNNILWDLPASVTIGINGTVLATATCATSGPVAAVKGTVNQINTPTRGWVSVTNATTAAIGSAAETDAELRLRQGQSVALPALTPFDALDGAIANVPGVTRHKLYENDTGVVDDNGVPAHSIAAIVDGGDATEIAQTLRKKKTLGAPTFGTTSINLTDAYGNLVEIFFSRPISVPIFVTIEIKAFTGYTSSVGDKIISAVVNYINSLGIGNNVYLGRLFSPANLTTGTDNNDSQFYDIDSIAIGISKTSVTTSNIAIAYDSLATCTAASISLTVVS
ncbi:baseplate J/gp47 family protein [Pantoea agglomerans]|uniref:baseplate J/gp47 family protein n=1 Tax=Enterobacter agglomerans TaxID=549 RepID=UPI0021D7CCE7|nr:baseplate J/gp47 family protein [Pantoea agglomerans]WNK50290.1 baseplate J/gp47 family protein [Pantoea agglomerans]